MVWNYENADFSLKNYCVTIIFSTLLFPIVYFVVGCRLRMWAVVTQTPWWCDVWNPPRLRSRRITTSLRSSRWIFMLGCLSTRSASVAGTMATMSLTLLVTTHCGRNTWTRRVLSVFWVIMIWSACLFPSDTQLWNSHPSEKFFVSFYSRLVENIVARKSGLAPVISMMPKSAFL